MVLQNKNKEKIIKEYIISCHLKKMMNPEDCHE